MFEIQVATSITQIEEKAWNGLAGEATMARREWHRVVEETMVTPAGWRYWLLQRDGCPVGCLSATVYGEEAGGLDLDLGLYGRGAGLARVTGLAVMPAMECGTRDGGAPVVLVAPELDGGERREVVRRLVEAAEETARSEGWSVVMRGVGNGETELRRILGELGYVATREYGTARLDLPAGPFSEYLLQVRRANPKLAKNVRREIGLAAKNGLTMERLRRPEECDDSLFRLLASHWTRLNGGRPPMREGFLGAVLAYMGERSRITVARAEGELVGMRVTFRSGERELARYIGVDRERGRASATYFNLGYNSLVREAMADGVRQVCYGKLLYEMKARRGCRVEEREMYVRPTGGWQRGVWRLFFPVRSRMLAKQWGMMPKAGVR